MSKSYQEKLKDPRWQKKRLEVLSRDGFKCIHCLDTESTLHVHHLKYSGDPWEVDIQFLESVCEHCHYIFSNVLPKDCFILGIKKIKCEDNNVAHFVDFLTNNHDRRFYIIHADKTGVDAIGISEGVVPLLKDFIKRY